MRLQPVPNVDLANVDLANVDLARFDLTKYPALKPGVNFFKVAGEGSIEDTVKETSDIYIGFSHRGIELKFEIAFDLLCLLDGGRTLGSIISAIEADVKSTDLISEVLLVLSNEGLIDFRSSPVPKLSPKKELLAANFVNSTNRMRAEANLYSWHPDVGIKKDTEALIGLRRNFSIIIYGRNRLALSLFAVLQASGFAQIKLTDRVGSASHDSTVQIEPSEVCGLAIRGSDVGLRKALVLADLARNSQLFPSENVLFPELPDLIISTESIPQETMQSWLSENIVHLPISNLVENKIVIGPIVIPGKTPCLNCLDLWRSDQFPHHNSFEILAALDSGAGKSLELPAAQVALLTGLITTQVIQYCTSLASEDSKLASEDSNSAVKLIGATLTIDLFDPLDSIASSDEAFGYRYWQPHTSCGCQRLI